MAQAFSKWFYNSKVWKKCRDSFFIYKNGLCERCGRSGVIVHHKQWLNRNNINNPDVTLNWDNLELLCNECHSKEHLGSDITHKDVEFDCNGNLIKK